MVGFTGVIIEESLENTSVLKKVRIIKSKVEPVTEKHRTPWVKQWTLHTVSIPEVKARDIAEEISKSLDSKHEWYADFKDDKHHYIIFRDKVFCIDRKSKQQYDEATQYGISLGIPEYQVNFSPNVLVEEMKIEKKVWSEYFQKILSDEKTFEVRLADFECKPGDILVLREWNPETNKYTGRIIEKKVTYVATTKNFKFWSKEDIDKYGYQIIAIK